MTTSAATCAYRYRSLGRCSQPAAVLGLCIFHCPKFAAGEPERHAPGIAELLDVANKRSRLEFASLIDSLENDPAVESLDFRGFRLDNIPRVALFQRVFSKRVLVTGAEFSGEVDFHQAVFARGVDFANAVFRGDAKFNLVTFRDKVSFFGVKFGADCAFTQARFEEHAEFQSAEFKAIADFWKTSFSAGASFIFAKFDVQAMFRAATFANDTNFSWAEFRGHVAFILSTFALGADFEGAKVTGDLHFIGDASQGVFQGDLSFCRVNQSDRNLVLFENANLEKALFQYTDLENVIFRSVRWHRAGKLVTRRALWDEFRPLASAEGRGYDRIAENYRQLVLNFERKRDYDDADEFHVGEMEIRRKRHGGKATSRVWRWFREWCNLSGAYRLFSRYGTSYRTGFAWLAAFVFVIFPALFLTAGFALSNEGGAPATRVIRYKIATSQVAPAPFSAWLQDYGNALAYTLSVLTFQRERFYIPVGALSRLCLLLAVLVLAAQTALTLLAIRRRFRR